MGFTAACRLPCHAMVVLTSSGLRATFAPEAGMVCASLQADGAELLGQRGGLEKYKTTGSTFGIPLLHPWANRWDRELDSPYVRIDPETGLPIHGLLNGWPEWTVTSSEADAVSAEFDFASNDELLRVFPYPHVVGVDASLGTGALTITTRVRPTGDVPVPIAFGWHPYLTLPGVPRDDWRVTLPVHERLVLDDRKLPTGEVEEVDYPAAMPLAGKAFDDGFRGARDGTVFAVEGGRRRLELEFVSGYPFAQVFAPPGDELIALEPMTAPTNALNTGDGLRHAGPGEPFEATFRVAVHTIP
jgi:aldose 1-epimerase